MRVILTCSSLLACTTLVLAGQVHVVNNCNFLVNYVSSAGAGPASKSKPVGSGFSRGYEQSAVLKFSKAGSKREVDEGIVQLEYSSTDTEIFYDTSNINGNPFQAEGTRLSPSVPPGNGHDSCVTVDCPAGAAVCHDAYNHPDDVSTKVCAINTDIVFTLCSGNGGSSSDSGGNGVDSGSPDSKANTGDTASLNSDTNTGNSGSSNANANMGNSNDNKSATNNDAPPVIATAALASSPTAGKSKHWGPHKRQGHSRRIL